MRNLYLAIDVGTGGIRAALVDQAGHILKICHKEHEQIVSQFGWSEQRPADWWHGTVETVREVVGTIDGATDRIVAICACGQMHGAVLIDEHGQLTHETALLWNDKRTLPQVERFEERTVHAEYLAKTANLPSPAWPAFKLMWMAQNDPEALDKASSLLMPKDYINFKLTGERALDWTEASMSFLMDCRSGDWSDELLVLTGLPRSLLSPIQSPGDILGTLQSCVAKQMGVAAGIPVLVGAGDYPMALLGSGVTRSGLASDVTGTSTIITVIHENPIIRPDVSNIRTVNGAWGSLTLLDAGGDAVRWARRAFHDNRRSYQEVADAAGMAKAGSSGLFFLPYLAGERFGEFRNSRSQYFGLTASHGMPELHRAVLEGVAFSVRKELASVQGEGGRPEHIVAASGGAKSELWLKIKASMYNVPYLVPEELECGVVGAAALMAAAVGDEPDLESAVNKMVRFEREVTPEPEWVELYDKMMPTYEKLYLAAQPLYADLDALG